MCHPGQDLEALDQQQLEDVWGGWYSLKRNVDWANGLSHSTIEAGSILGAGFGAWRGVLAHRRDATTVLGVASGRVPVRITGTGIGLIGGAIGTGMAGWAYGFAEDGIRQYLGKKVLSGGEAE
jgi:hypothetical protein